ncbi:hypothetical protein [Catenuloplanes indicus]|uniref:Uncharacterized protein n=1 Tax=Catenuloplanes indicus TaxID=137267 RepID=A0AAE3VWB3_9ACTN|nr:hypothetical protein [Catenuloplanes indicus]MDQ0364865.1 hypothetical protein [Catenuloplanes indicus]
MSSATGVRNSEVTTVHSVSSAPVSGRASVRRLIAPARNQPRISPAGAPAIVPAATPGGSVPRTRR